MAKKHYIITNIIWILIGAALLFELVRDSTRDGDFIGYIIAGYAVLNHVDIYLNWINMWPPFFSVFSVIFAVIDSINPVLVRALWLSGSLAAFYGVLNLCLKITLASSGQFKKFYPSINFRDWIVIVPVLIILRFILENMGHLQFNIYMLLLACASIYYFIHNKPALAGFLLALSISLKVYTVILLLYFLYKREWKISAWAFVFILLINSVTFAVFGYSQAASYYIHWFTQKADSVHSYVHLNQSLFGFFSRLLTSGDPESNFYTNLFRLSQQTAKIITCIVIVLISLVPAYLFRKKLEDKGSLRSISEYFIVLNIIPLFSLLSWKAYFIFLFPAYVLIFIRLFKNSSTLKNAPLKFLKYLFAISIILNVFTTDGIVGKRMSDIFQSLSCITFGSLLLLSVQLVLYWNMRAESTAIS